MRPYARQQQRQRQQCAHASVLRFPAHARHFLCYSLFLLGAQQTAAVQAHQRLLLGGAHGRSSARQHQRQQETQQEAPSSRAAGHANETRDSTAAGGEASSSEQEHLRVHATGSASLSLFFVCYYDDHFGDALEIADARVGVEKETCGSSLYS